MDIGVKVVGGSVDSVESVAKLRDGLYVGFPMWGELDAATVSADTGAPVSYTHLTLPTKA